MIDLTFNYALRTAYGSKEEINVGVLATSGSLQTKIFEKSAESFNATLNTNVKIFTSLTVKNGNQKNFTTALFSNTGIKAGFSDVMNQTEARTNLLLILEEVFAFYRNGIRAVVLGCTELPLVFSQSNLKHVLMKAEEDESLLDGYHYNVDDLKDLILFKKIQVIDPSKVLADEVLRLTLFSRA